MSKRTLAVILILVASCVILLPDVWQEASVATLFSAMILLFLLTAVSEDLAATFFEALGIYSRPKQYFAQGVLAVSIVATFCYLGTFG